MPDKKSLSENDQKNMNFAMRLSFFVGAVMLAIKMYAYLITGSAAILSDAAESVIHVLAVGFAAYSMWLSLKPADANHLYGHDKVSFFSAGFEGATIIAAAFFIFHESWDKIHYGYQLENVDTGLIILGLAIVINLILGFFLFNRGKQYNSLILESNGKHVLTDCWTSLGAVAALLLVKMTGFTLFDPLIAIIVGCIILYTGTQLLKKSIHGLMDQSDTKLQNQLTQLISQETAPLNIQFHHLKHRMSGYKVYVEFHLLFPDDISLKDAHDSASKIESKIKNALARPSEIVTHLETQQQHDAIHAKYGLPI